MNIPAEFLEIPIADIRPSGTNPRKDFRDDYLNDLAATIRRIGVLQPALVRPAYCVGSRTHAEIVSARSARPSTGYVLIAGECRRRASQIAQRATLPCMVREMTDDDAREAQQIENLQRKDVTPLEEAQGYEEILALRKDDGTPRYTVASLAERIGRDVAYVYRRRALLNLPEIAKAALRDGRITPKVARVILQVPSADAREKFALKVLKPEMALGPLGYEAARQLRAQFTVSLKATIFNLGDATLLPEAGACLACPKMAGNMPHIFEQDETAAWKSHTCMDPVCYRAKLSALFTRQGEAAKAQGKALLSVEESAAIYPEMLVAGMMAPTSPYVELGRKPEPHLLKKEVALSPACTWGRLVDDAEKKTGANVPRVLVRDQSHVLHEVVDMKQAMALIEKSGEPIFRGSEGSGGAIVDQAKVDKKSEKEAAKLQRAATLLGFGALAEAFAGGGWEADGVWNALLDLAVEHAGPDGLALLAEWQGLAPAALPKWMNDLDPETRADLLPLLLLAPSMRVNGIRAAGFVALASALGIDAKGLEKKARGESKTVAKEKSAKLSGAALEARVRELRRENKSETDIFLALQVPKRALRALLKKIDAEETAAKR